MKFLFTDGKSSHEVQQVWLSKEQYSHFRLQS